VLQIIKNQDNFETKIDWLTSYHHFSFGEHFHPDKNNFGPLRVFNDDLIQAGKGFDFHQHRDMEIVTYVTEGILEHKDNFGNNGIIETGEVQRMSTGTGVFHSEYNHSNQNPLKLLQIWIFPNKKGLKPSWQERKFTKDDRLDKLLCIVSSNQTDSSLLIHQDVSFYVSRLENGEVNHKFTEGRLGYLFVINGKLKVNRMELDPKDAVKIQHEKSIIMKSSGSSELILLDLPAKYDSVK
jgi:redox-sensitive bicupin YhaK (pirin superfamily)